MRPAVANIRCFLLFPLLALLLGVIGVRWAAAQTRPTFVLVFVPVSWQGTRDDFRRAADEHASAFITASEIDRYANIEIQYVDEILHTRLDSDDLVSKIETFALSRAPGDRYIGLTDGDIVLDGNSKIVGWTYRGNTTVVCEIEDPYVTAHELGHTFGLCDEYAYGPWSRQNKFKTCPNPYPDHCATDTGNKVNCSGWPVGDTWCVMGPSSSRLKVRRFDPYCEAHLQSVFQQLFPNGPLPTVTPLPTSTPRPPGPTAPPKPSRTPTAVPPPTPKMSPTVVPNNLFPAGMLAVAIPEQAGSTLFLYEPYTGTLQRLDPTAGHAYASSWSPDSSRIAFVSDQRGSRGLFLLDRLTGATSLLWDSPGDENSPSWSPDGTEIVFSSDATGYSRLYLLQPGSNTEPIPLTTGPGQDQDPAWHPQDRIIAFSSDRDGDLDLYLLTLTGSGAQTIAQVTRLTDWAGAEIMPAWSPDGQHLAFAANQSGVFSLYLLNLTSGQIRSIQSAPQHCRYPAWMPDGEWIVYRTGFDDAVELTFLHLPSGQEWVPTLPAREGTFPSVRRP